MRALEIRRHSKRSKPGAHLSRDGIALAQLVGRSSGPFNLVITSTIPRAVETVIAMGFDVDQTVEALGHLPEDVFHAIRWPNAFAGVAEVIANGGHSATFAKKQAALWREIAGQLSDTQQALIITHGAFVELGAVACLPDANHHAWGDAVAYCEGIRLSYGDGDCPGAEILRVPEEHHLVEN